MAVSAQTPLIDYVASGSTADFIFPFLVTEEPHLKVFVNGELTSFMYVIYILILSSIPMGVLYAFSPDTATAITTGFKSWLQAIPEEMLALFGVGYVGYATARSVEKVKGRVK